MNFYIYLSIFLTKITNKLVPGNFLPLNLQRTIKLIGNFLLLLQNYWVKQCRRKDARIEQITEERNKLKERESHDDEPKRK